MAFAPNLIIPIDDAACRIERRPDLADHAGRERLPAMFLFAHPLDLDRLPRHRLRQQRRVGGGVVGAIMPVASRSLGMDAAHLVERHTQHLRDRLLIGIDALGMSPDAGDTVVEHRDGA